MQHSSVLTFVSVFFMVQVLIALATSYFLARWFPLYQRRSVRVIYWSVTLVAYAAIFCRRAITAADYGPLKEIIMLLLNFSYVWSVTLLAMLAGFILIFLARMPGLVAAFFKKRKQQPVSGEGSAINRRTFLKSAAVAVPFFSFGLGVEGVLNANSKIVLTRRQLILPGLSADLDGLKIAQLTDTHIGSYFGMDKLEQVIGMLEAEKPHLLVITGDFIDELSLLPPAFDLLNPFAAKLPYGAYFCWGNHEYFRSISLIKKHFDQSPVTVLKNQNKLVCPASSPLYLVGVDYPFYRTGADKAALRQKYLKAATKGLPAKATPILISHHSDFIEEAFDAGIPLTLSGHTHGGQVTLFGKSLLPVSYKYMLGMYSRQNCHAYVSTGAGHWLPFRFNCPAEAVVFTLKSQ